ncbi:MAG: COX15/CtaA family protein, partial [Planctomycetota bacterium]
TALTTFGLLVAGGVVTGLEAGLAVPGWLTAFDYPLVLFPLRLMQEDGGVYAEHAHRLWGLLVGLSTLVLFFHLWRRERRRWVVAIGAAVLVAVIVQGALGGTRVLEESIVLAIAHGIFGQVVFAAMVALAVCTAPTFALDAPVDEPVPGQTERLLSGGLVLVVLSQLMLGAVYRHLNDAADATAVSHAALGGHLIMAVVAVIFAIAAGGRGAVTHRNKPTLRRLGIAIIAIVQVQVVLGVIALILVLVRGDEPRIPPVEVALTTAHQATGAAILAMAVAFATWMRALSAREAISDRSPASAPA